VGEHRREGVGKKGGQRKKINMAGPTFGGGNGGPPRMDDERGIWRGMQNGGLFKSPVGDGSAGDAFRIYPAAHQHH
jgi:hypothetical protein